MKIEFRASEIGFGGGERLILDLIFEAKARGYDVRWVVVRGSELEKRLGGNFRDGSIDGWSADITIANDFASVRSLRRRPRSLAYICHGSWQLTRKMALILAFLGAQVWCVSTQVLSSAARVSIMSGRTWLLPYGPKETPPGRSEYSREEARKLLSISPNDFVVANVARYHTVKRLGLFVSAIDYAETRALLWTSYGFNSSEELSAREELALRALPDTLRVIENEDPLPLLRAADVFLSTSTSETLGIAMLEALARGVPVLSTAAGGAQDFIRHGLNGFRIHGGLDAIRSFLDELSSDPELRALLSRGARATAVGRSPMHALDSIVSVGT